MHATPAQILAYVLDLARRATARDLPSAYDPSILRCARKAVERVKAEPADTHAILAAAEALDVVGEVGGRESTFEARAAAAGFRFLYRLAALVPASEFVVRPCAEVKAIDFGFGPRGTRGERIEHVRELLEAGKLTIAPDPERVEKLADEWRKLSPVTDRADEGPKADRACVTEACGASVSGKCESGLDALCPDRDPGRRDRPKPDGD